MNETPTLKMAASQSPTYNAMVTRDDANLLHKIRCIVRAGQNVEIRCDRSGKIKAYSVSKKEIS